MFQSKKTKSRFAKGKNEVSDCQRFRPQPFTCIKQIKLEAYVFLEGKHIQ